jgi:hypothetical protein
MSGNPSILTGKRKRAAVSYAEPDDVLDLESDEEHNALLAPASLTESDDDDDDDTFGARRKVSLRSQHSCKACSLTSSQKTAKKAPPKKKAKITPKAKKEQSFRFLDLPAELRDMIYEMTLSDANGVSIRVYQSGYRRVARRGPVYSPESYARGRYGRGNYLKPDQDELCAISTEFVPALLAVDKQINAEAINYLYGHAFVFENTTALHSFLAPMGPRNQQRLISIEIMAWGSSGQAKGHNYSGLTLLAGATNLKSLTFACDVSYWSNQPGRIAARIFRDAHWFFEAYGAANGRKDAAVDILELDKSNFICWRNPSADEATQVERFKTSLRGLLGVETTGKSRK